MQRKTNFKITLILFAVAAITAYIFIEPYLTKITEIEIKDQDIPASFLDKKIVFISDIHFGFNYSSWRLERLVNKINSLNPDIILLGGDYIEKKASLAESCFAQLQKLKAPLGVYGVLGNHDHWESANAVKEAMKDADIINVDNNGVWLTLNDQKIRVGGVGDLWNDTQDLDSAADGAGSDDFFILLSHNPEYAEQIKTDTVDLMLSGHHHGGQVSLFNLWTLLMRTDYGAKYKSGLVNAPKTQVFVSSGVGTTWLPIRFFARPEIVVVNL